MTYSIEIKDEFYGQSIPAWLRCFDCRNPEGQEFSKEAPWTHTNKGHLRHPILMGCETAQVDLGLRAKGESNAAVPISGSGYGDTRRNAEEAKLAVERMLEAAHRLHSEYEEASRQPMSTNGGSVIYQPIAVALCNFGWSLICDRRISRVVSFGS